MIEDIILALRPIIATQSEVELDDVLNSDSIRGAGLFKVVNGQQIPYETTDTVIVFELNELQTTSISYENDDDTIFDLSSHQMRLVIYGDLSRTVARKLRARMLSQKVINELHNKNISILQISNIDGTTETINTTRYIRRDLSIDILYKLEITQVDSLKEINNANIDITNL